MVAHELTVIVYPGKDRYISQCLDVDVASNGTTESEATDKILEALDRYFEEYERERAAVDPQAKAEELNVHVLGILP